MYTVGRGLLLGHLADGPEQVPVGIGHGLDGLVELALDESGEPAILQFEVVDYIPVLGVDAAVDVKILAHVHNIANVLTSVNHVATNG